MSANQNFILPLPRVANVGEKTVLDATVACADAPSFADATDTLADYAYRIHGITLRSDGNGLTFSEDKTLPEEGYRITVQNGKALVEAADPLGAQHAASTLIQLMEPCDGGLTLPSGTIEDAPECSFRSVMIDLARDFHELAMLFEYVDLCRFYKIRYLHLHFTDDQSYTLPSRAFPKLSTPGRSYTEEEIRNLLAYAKKRGVEIIPEIDVPGHCTSFANAYGDIFGTNGIISQSEESMNAMTTLFCELCDLFADSAFIHVGGDEAAIGKWTEDEKTLEAFRAQGVDVDMADRDALAQIMYATFIRRTSKAVLSCGKTPIVWEGFGEAVNHLIPKETVVMSWENFYQTTPVLQKAGFRLLNCSWAPMYIVTPIRYWTLEEVYHWNVYRFEPVHPDSPFIGKVLTVDPTDQIEGGELLAWGDAVMSSYPNLAEGTREEQRLVAERASALAENTWNREKRTDFAEFSERYAHVSALYRVLNGHL